MTMSETQSNQPREAGHGHPAPHWSAATTPTGEPLPPWPEALEALRADLDQLRHEVARLDADLDESRRLNLRAAELLDVVYTELGKKQQ
jgi:hypothetical protein